MAGRDPGNKPARRIGLAAIAAVVVIAILLAVFVTHFARPLSHGTAQPPASAR